MVKILYLLILIVVVWIGYRIWGHVLVREVAFAKVDLGLPDLPQGTLHNADSLKSRIEEVGLGKIAEPIIQLARESVRLLPEVDSSDLTHPGVTRVGGLPDLPEKLEWPHMNRGRSLAFVAQINFAEIAEVAKNSLLPEEGILYVFYNAGDLPFGYNAEDHDKWKLLYWDGEISLLRSLTKFPEDLYETERFFPFRLKPTQELMVPTALSEVDSQLYAQYGDQFSDTKGEFQSRYWSLQNEDELVNQTHLSGHPNYMQGPGAELLCEKMAREVWPEEMEDSSEDDWILLLQIDSFDMYSNDIPQDSELIDMIWGDSGYLYFWIRKQDLKNRDFSKVWLDLQCG